MSNKFLNVLMALFVIFMLFQSGVSFAADKADEKDNRMEWWREARFGMFIHWGLYALPAGEWNDNTNYAEWIRNNGKIPIDVYDKFVDQFNPVDFNADEWVKLAKEAGMKYVVITSKHHDGFCLFDSKYTDFDIMSTPFKRDIMKEMAEACRSQDLKMCWYHSIMDWHHPDYLPRRGWEKESRPIGDANYDRYVSYMKNQLRELTTNYGKIGVLWFDGEWESTWTQEYGQDLYKYVRGLQPDIIINNRVSPGRSGLEGFSKGGEYKGDFGTPEQQIPATGLPGVDWETCMTMNNHWGYNKNDFNWKSTRDLLQKLADIASKGGNFLLNVGPTAEGLIPKASINRLKEIGAWMKINGESIYGTHASPFRELSWGRCTQKFIKTGTRLYLHVFDWPEDGQLTVPGIYNKPENAYLLADNSKQVLSVKRHEDSILINTPSQAPDSINSVIVLDIDGKADVNDPPDIVSDFDIFIDNIEVTITSDRENVDMRYTTDGSVPTISSPSVQDKIRLTKSVLLSTRCFRDNKAVSGIATRKFTKVNARPAISIENPVPGIKYAYYEGDWDSLPDFSSLSPIKTGVLKQVDFSPGIQVDNFGFIYESFLRIDQTGVYAFYTESDDGSQLFIGDEMVVNNDGLHGLKEQHGVIALEKGFHPIRVTFFEKGGDEGLYIVMSGSGLEKQAISPSMLFIKE